MSASQSPSRSDEEVAARDSVDEGAGDGVADLAAMLEEAPDAAATGEVGAGAANSHPEDHVSGDIGIVASAAANPDPSDATSAERPPKVPRTGPSPGVTGVGVSEMRATVAALVQTTGESAVRKALRSYHEEKMNAAVREQAFAAAAAHQTSKDSSSSCPSPPRSCSRCWPSCRRRPLQS